MTVKIVIVVLLLAIVSALMVSMVFLIRDPSSRRRTLTSLKIRVALSVTMILFVLLAYWQGWIKPHGIVPVQMPPEQQQPQP